MTSKNNETNRYSISRYNNNSEKLCQYCSSCDHWTYECPHKSCSQKDITERQKQLQLHGHYKKSKKQSELQETNKQKPASVKLSPSQMLKYGIKRKRYNFVPEMTEKEEFDTSIKRVEKDLMTIAKKTKTKEITEHTNCLTPNNTYMQHRVKKEIASEENAFNEQKNDDVKRDKGKIYGSADVSNGKCDLTAVNDVIPCYDKVEKEQQEIEEEYERY